MEQEHISGLRRAVSAAHPFPVEEVLQVSVSSTSKVVNCTVMAYFIRMATIITFDFGRFAPVVFFKPNIKVKSGDGTKSNPYEIGK